jgi:hypothetical protein
MTFYEISKSIGALSAVDKHRSSCRHLRSTDLAWDSWLVSQQNADGSWGATPDIQPVYTSAAARALASAYKLQYAYFAGVTWLESHDSDNVDLIARQVDSLIDHGDDLSPAQAYLQTAQVLSGATYAGWGLWKAQ